LNLLTSAATHKRGTKEDMDIKRIRTLFSLLISSVTVIAGMAPIARGAEAPLTVRLDTKHPGASIAPEFAGLSFEVALVLPGPNGVHYFRSNNLPLITLFHTLGIEHLRIGGNTSDRNARELPSKADLDSLFAFAKAAGVKVIYCLRLHNGNPQEAASVVKYIMDHYAPQVDCFSIGQEPSAYPVEKVDTRPPSERMGAAAEKYRYEDYRKEWKLFADAIVAAVPNVKFCGPGVHNNAVWARRFMEDFARSNHVALITEHLYPGGAGGKVPSPEVGRDRMLSNDFVRAYQRLHDGFVPVARSNSLPYRLEEVNNYFNGGATNVSNTFASALWGLDFMYWWAAHGAAGLNFHTGDRVAAGSRLTPSRYTAFFSTTNGFVVRPLGYGIKAFALGGRGRLLPLTMPAQPESNLSGYGVLAPDNTVYVTLINKAHGPGAAAATVALDAGPGYARGQVLFLAAPEGDVAAQTGVTLGGAVIREDGTWAGTWTALAPSPAGAFTVKVPAASAAIIRLGGA
jgi:hypothetical protein